MTNFMRMRPLLLLMAVLGYPGRLAADSPAHANQRDPQRFARLIDQEIQAQLVAKELRSAGLASDAEFLRRLYLDLHGVIPPLDRVIAFLDDTKPQKRTRLIEQLLADQQYGRYQGDIWFRLLVPQRQGKDRSPHHLFKSWLEKSFHGNKPWNQMSYEILTATATSKEAIAANPAALWLMVDSTKTLEVTDATDLVCQVFLGIRMNCAQCHNHPFVKWKRQDYWGMAAFFTRITRRPGFGLIESPTFTPKLPEYAQVVPARFLGGAEAKLDAAAPYRPVLAKWVTAPDNPFFARAMVNRIWAHLFGRGIVHPFDDMHEENPPSHPKLLQLLTEEFVASGYDVKYLIRAICESDVYQRSSLPHDDAPSPPEWLAYRPVRVLTAWQLYDSLARSDSDEERARRDFIKARNDFAKFFTANYEANALAYERGIPQALQLMNALRLEGLLSQVVSPDQEPANILEKMYLTVLGRRPSATENARMLAHVNRSATSQQGYADVLWVLLQASEFTLNH
jgi:hypothetical protein